MYRLPSFCASSQIVSSSAARRKRILRALIGSRASAWEANIDGGAGLPSGSPRQLDEEEDQPGIT
jgi:hypothetical protein